MRGKLHRENGPAKIYEYETDNGRGGFHEEWRQNGKLHRDVDPAYISGSYESDKIVSINNQRWYQNGKLHRRDGPALDSRRLFRSWEINGIEHREDGPANIFPHRDVMILFGEEYDNIDDYNKMVDLIKYFRGTALSSIETTPSERTPPIESQNISVVQLPTDILIHIATIGYGRAYREMLAIPAVARFAIKNRNWIYTKITKVIELSGQPAYTVCARFHRYPEDEHAVIFPNGGRWYRWGKLHRENGPAVISVDIEKWYQDGKIHRDGGPAVINILEWEEWWQNGKLHRDNGPAVIYYEGGKSYYKKGKLHRDDGPAQDYTEEMHNRWYLNGKRHRKDGPSCIFPKQFDIYGIRFREQDYYEIIKHLDL